MFNFIKDLGDIFNVDFDVKFSIFPAGELNVELSDCDIIKDKQYTITLTSFAYRNPYWLHGLIILSGYLKEKTGRKVLVNMSYLPYSRQDREIKKTLTQPFSEKYIYETLKNCGYIEYIKTEEIHSKTIQEELDGSFIINDEESTLSRMFSFDKTNQFFKYLLVYPDKGARLRYSFDVDYIMFDKVRNGGKIELEVYECSDESIYKHNLESLKIVVIDDICDGGNTFIEVSKKLDELFGEKVEKSLLTYHGIYSNSAIDKLKEHYKNIFSQNSVYPNR